MNGAATADPNLRACIVATHNAIGSTTAAPASITGRRVTAAATSPTAITTSHAFLRIRFAARGCTASQRTSSIATGAPTYASNRDTAPRCASGASHTG